MTINRNHVLRFSADLDAYVEALTELQAVLDDCGVCARGRYKVELVFEEIVGNIMRHGRSDAGEHDIEVSLTFRDGAVVMSFCDDGPPFDPRHHIMPELSHSLEHVKVGGLGLMLVRKTCERMDYERTLQNQNHLTIAIAAA